MSFLKAVQKKIQNPFASIVAEGIVGDLSGFIDTGSYTFNALISGSIYGGFPDNKITVLAGPEATGKSYILLTAIANFLKTFPKGSVILFESESAQRKELMEKMGVDVSRVLFDPVQTVQEFRTHILQILDEYKTLKPEIRKEERLFLALDSLGNLSTSKEMEDSTSGKETQDMTRAKLIKSTFRTITLKLGILSVPLVCTNHTYQTQGLFSTTEMGGGCLFPNTNIVMCDGSSKKVSEVKQGDWVFTASGPCSVTQAWTPDNLEDPLPECVRVQFQGHGGFVECSLDHRFWVGGNWKSIKDCQPGMILTGFKPPQQVVFRTIASIIPLGRRPVFDIEVETSGHYVLSDKEGNLFSHNSGPKFNASTVIYLTKKKEKDGTIVVGNIVHALVNKSRFTREGSKIDTFISFSSGLERFYGLLELGLEQGIVIEKGRRFEFPNGEIGFRKDIRANPQRFFTEDVLLQFESLLSNLFKFGGNHPTEQTDEDSSEEIEELEI